MDTARWARVRSILESAIDVDGAALETLLARECGQDRELRLEVESLLAANPASAGLEPPAPSELARAISDPNLGRRIGPYAVERVLGIGGMGVVYLARRAGADFEQRVALKLIKRGMDTDDILRQFRRERALLAGLEHPGIARLFDGGATDDGLPWLAMEYVEGRPINAWCEEHALGVRARLELFIAVCGAVRYAHQRLIVHCDLKPSNILVAQDGTVRLLDFGIAKLLAPDAEAVTSNTMPGQRRLTPEYASPEQLRGESASTATDVYSLGVILYELLTGQNPFKGASTPERGDPDRPSTRVTEGAAHRDRSVASWRRDLRGDLDTITLTALATDIRQRYASVEALELDVRRHLDGLPIEARPATASYRARKFIARNRIAVAAAGAIFASLAIGLAFARSGYLEAVEQSGIAEQRRLAAEKEARRANSVLKLTREMLGNASPHDIKSKDYTLRQLLDEFDARFDTETTAEPDVEASVREIMGRAYRELGLLDKSKHHLDRALELSPGALLENDETSLGLACDWLYLLHDQGAFARVEEESEKILARLGSDNSTNPIAATLRMIRGDCLSHIARLDEAKTELSTALAVFNAQPVIAYGDVLHCMGLLLAVLDRQGASDEARSFAEQVVELARKHTGDRSLQTSTALNDFGHVALRRGELADAEKALREALSIERELHDEHPALAPILTNLGTVLRQRGDYTGAEPLLREAVALSRKAFGDKHPSLAVDLGNLGSLLQAKGDFEGAETAMREALEIRIALNGEENVDVARSMNNLGLLLRSRGKNEDSESLLRKALAVRRKLLGDRDVAVAATLANLAGTLTARGDLDGAESAAREALSIDREALPAVNADLASILGVLSSVLLRKSEYAESRALAEEALSIRQQLFGPEHPDIARSLWSLGETLNGAGDLEAADSRLREALAMQRQLISPSHPDLARTLYSLGDVAERAHRDSEARTFMTEALAIRRKALGDARKETRDAGARLAAMLEASGDSGGAKVLRAELHLPESGAAPDAQD